MADLEFNRGRSFDALPPGERAINSAASIRRRSTQLQTGKPPYAPRSERKGLGKTVRCNPGEITTVIIRFDLPSLLTEDMRKDVSPRTGGKEYVWHCQILEHEGH